MIQSIVRVHILFFISLAITGCIAKPDPPAPDPLTLWEGESAQSVVERIVEQADLPMPAQADEAIWKALFGFDPSELSQEFFGVISMKNGCADQVFAMRANPQDKEKAANAMLGRLLDVQMAYSEDENESVKTQNAQLINKGDYFFLVVVGEDAKSAKSDIETAIQTIEEAFDDKENNT